MQSCMVYTTPASMSQCRNITLYTRIVSTVSKFPMVKGGLSKVRSDWACSFMRVKPPCFAQAVHTPLKNTCTRTYSGTELMITVAFTE